MRGRAPESRVTSVSAPFFLIAPTPLTYQRTERRTIATVKALWW